MPYDPDMLVVRVVKWMEHTQLWLLRELSTGKLYIAKIDDLYPYGNVMGEFYVYRDKARELS